MIDRRTIISGSALLISAIFSLNDSVLGANDQSDLFFRYLKERCHGNQFCEKNGKLPSFVALAFRTEMGYYYLNVRFNSVNDASIYRVKISWTSV